LRSAPGSNRIQSDKSSTHLFDIVFTQFDVVEPDLLYISNERAREILTAKHVVGAPEIIVEIGSPSTRQRDETIKRRLYERSVSGSIGSPIRRSTPFESFDASEAGDVLSSPLLPDLSIPLETIFGQ
jgi:Uma2 family endonuclease